jgi:hypothetical protein
MSLSKECNFCIRTRRASEAPAGLPQARRRPAEKTGAGFIYVMHHLIGKGGV